jgi:energy-coupling factor transport system substrate-specific component
MERKNSGTGLNGGLLVSGIAATAALRVIMAPIPNVEPIMTATMVAGVAGGPLAGLLMGICSMVLSNILLAGGPLTFPWIFMMPLITVYTSLSYGVIGLAAGIIAVFRKKWSRSDFALFALVATLFYDFVTAVCFGLQLYGPAGIYGALVSQVPFTVYHLSNVVLAFVLAPHIVKAISTIKEAGLQGFTGVFRAN